VGGGSLDSTNLSSLTLTTVNRETLCGWQGGFKDSVTTVIVDGVTIVAASVDGTVRLIKTTPDKKMLTTAAAERCVACATARAHHKGRKLSLGMPIKTPQQNTGQGAQRLGES
jgi:hypothetical protein